MEAFNIHKSDPINLDKLNWSFKSSCQFIHIIYLISSGKFRNQLLPWSAKNNVNLVFYLYWNQWKILIVLFRKVYLSSLFFQEYSIINTVSLIQYESNYFKKTRTIIWIFQGLAPLRTNKHLGAALLSALIIQIITQT